MNNLFEVVSSDYVIEDHEDLNSKSFINAAGERYKAFTFENRITIGQLVNEIPMEEYASFKPVPAKLISEAFLTTNPNPTPANYFDLYIDHIYKEQNGRKVSDLSSENSVTVPAKKDWIDPSIVTVSTLGEQRIQTQDRKACRNTFDRAVDFNFKKAVLRLARLKFADDELYCYDGGGSATSAVLRGIKSMPATIVDVYSLEELRSLFTATNRDYKTNVSAVDLFKTDLMNHKPLARLQDRIMEIAEVTPLKDHPDGLKLIDLGVLKKVLTSTIANCEQSSISGDTRDQVCDESLFKTRKAPYVIEALDVIKEVWPDEDIHSSTFQTITTFKGIFNGAVTYSKLVRMLRDYKSGEATLASNTLDSNAMGWIDITSQTKFSSSLNLTNIVTKKNHGAVMLARMWNAYYKSDRKTHKIQEAFLRHLYNDTKHKRYDDTRDYSNLI